MNDPYKLSEEYEEELNLVESKQRFNQPLGKGFNSSLNRSSILAARKRKRDLELGRESRLSRSRFNRKLSKSFNRKPGRY